MTAPKLVFHPDFATGVPGDIILQAGDEQAQCFYFSLSLLAALASFFATLPPPSAADLVLGYPLVPLHNSTSAGLHMFASAMRSSKTSGFIPFPPLQSDWEDGVLDAAYLARVYDAPLVPLLLVDTLRHGHLQAADDRYLIFAIWAIFDAQHRLEDAAVETTLLSQRHITDVPPCIVKACRNRAPQHWSQLQDLHLRRSVAMRNFRTKVKGAAARYSFSARTRNAPFCACG